jgi:hypothetical protein
MHAGSREMSDLVELLTLLCIPLGGSQHANLGARVARLQHNEEDDGQKDTGRSVLHVSLTARTQILAGERLEVPTPSEGASEW